MEARSVLDGIVLGIKRFFQWLWWLRSGKPVIAYPGYHCGLCGSWVGEKFEMPEYLSSGEWSDTWGVCSECGGDVK